MSTSLAQDPVTDHSPSTYYEPDTQHRGPEGRPRPHDTAVFIDLENLVKGYAMSADKINQLDMEGLLDKIKNESGGVMGRFALARAYANWDQHKLYHLQSQMRRSAIEQTHVAYVSGTHKDLCDLALAVDVMDTLHTRPHIQTYVLVSGDGGFAWMVRRLHEYGKTVIVAAYEQQFNDALKQLADYGVRLKDPEEAPRPEARNKDATVQTLLDVFGRRPIKNLSGQEIRNRLRDLFARLPDVSRARAALEAGVSMSVLETWLCDLFDLREARELYQEALGYSQLRVLVEEMTGGSHYRIVTSEGQTNPRLEFLDPARRVEVPGAPAKHHVEIGKAYEGKAQATSHMPRPLAASAASSGAPSKSFNKLVTQATELLNQLDRDGWDFDEGVELGEVAIKLHGQLPPAQIVSQGIGSYDQLIALAAADAQMVVQTTAKGAGLVTLQSTKKSGYKPARTEPPLEVKSVEFYRQVLALNAVATGVYASKAFYIIPSPELMGAAIEFVAKNRDKNQGLNDWIKQLEAHLVKNNRKAPESEIKTTLLALNAADVFVRTPPMDQLINQRLQLQANLLSASMIYEALRGACGSKIQELTGQAPDMALLKQITG